MKTIDKANSCFASLLNGIKFLWDASHRDIICIILYSALNGILGPINALIWMSFLDNVSECFITHILPDKAVLYLMIMSLFTVVGYVINSILQYVKQTFSDKLDLYVTNAVLNKSLSFSMEIYDKPEVYNQLNIAITQTSQQCLSLLDTFSEMVYAVIQIIGMMALIVQYNYIIALISLSSVIPLAVVSIKSNTYWYQVFAQRVEKFRLINYLKIIMIKNENIKEIKLFQTGRKIVDLIAKNYEDFINSDKKARKLFMRNRSGTQIFDEMISCGVKIWILYLSLKQRVTIGTSIMLFNAQSLLKGSLLSLINQFASLHSSSLYLQAVQKVQEIPCKNEDGSVPFDSNFSRIEFNDVSFKYPNSNNYALIHFSLVFEKGKTYSVVGFNGSGKTTLIKLLLKLYEPTSGTIYVDGINLQDINTISYHRQICAVFQDFIKYPFSVAENIDVNAQNISMNDIPQIRVAGKIADADEFICNLPNGYRTRLMKDWNNGTDISQGQWQKIAIARCFFRDSVISVLDEPFSSIDSEAENCIVEKIRERKDNRLNIFITHRFSSITLADEIIVIEHGKVTEQGCHAELLKNNGTYAKLFKAQLISLEQL